MGKHERYQNWYECYKHAWFNLKRNIWYLWKLIYEIDFYFYEHYEKQIQVDKNGHKYILFRTDVYFDEFLLVVEIYEKGHTDRDLTFEKKWPEALEKKLACKFIRINTSNAKNTYDLDYEVSDIEAFIDEFNKKKIKTLEHKIKEKRRIIKQKTNKTKK